MQLAKVDPKNAYQVHRVYWLFSGESNTPYTAFPFNLKPDTNYTTLMFLGNPDCSATVTATLELCQSLGVPVTMDNIGFSGDQDRYCELTTLPTKGKIESPTNLVWHCIWRFTIDQVVHTFRLR